eukprot:CAMPEP_0181233156 /NCGR_PEP_ID=MMETSP1096-20121128/36171_1 /TAXON_ID=156174 ORGANISM="Chrysochromulina ericina, Strain CCMP281" /NCGR_SAMPLE_ID=MMETSP1096 /ASSEMBLY_ACC=CAM_ASM_000453 /LENGTH=40 /DNA_ID= /DNA_START= /DNA_END= /DNA_ORIENTATION=
MSVAFDAAAAAAAALLSPGAGFGRARGERLGKAPGAGRAV